MQLSKIADGLATNEFPQIMRFRKTCKQQQNMPMLRTSYEKQNSCLMGQRSVRTFDDMGHLASGTDGVGAKKCRPLSMLYGK